MIENTEAIRQLTAAIILQAVKDAVTGGGEVRKKDENGKWHDNKTRRELLMREARAWLRGEDCLYYCECIGMDHTAICAWLDNGCKVANKTKFRSLMDA